MGPGKAPGPDGFSGHFYRKYWNTIGPQVCQEVKLFFQNSRMPSGWNDTHLVIIPKIPHPEEITQFRPISCCNFNYKIISKIMATRLKKWIPTIVSEMQAAFTSGRAIQDNIMIVHEVLHHFKNNTRKLKWDMMIKMDMKKAYDMVEWDGLDKILKAMGFHDVWCRWIEECVKTVRFSVLLNGHPSDTFKPTRGIRQGDPISPFLFILLTNSLSFLIDKGLREGRLKGMKINERCPTLTHVLFADDTIIFGDASASEAITIRETMEKYANLTGQTINPDKSSIKFSKHTPNALKEIIKGYLGFQRVSPFGKYLGVPSEWGGSKKEVFRYLIERMENLGQSWKSLSLSHGGKETLLKAVYQSIPTYIMSCFLLPKDMTNKMNSRLNAFFWGGTMDRKTIHWAKGTILTKPKAEGGLGFKDFHTFNLALLAKQGWRMINNPNLLWVRLLKGIYFRNGDFLNAKKGKKASWIWASLCDAREVLIKGARMNVVNGAKTRIFQDAWVPTITNFRIQEENREETTVDHWINNETREWKKEEMDRICTPEEVNEIIKIPIGPSNGEDHWVWHYDKKGNYSVKSGYHILRTTSPNHTNDRLTHLDKHLWKWMWRIPIPPKFLFFIWRLTRNAVATKKNLWIRKCAPSPNCPVCYMEEEDVLHCLFRCNVAERAWNKAHPRIDLPSEGTTVLQWLAKDPEGNHRPETQSLIALMWTIWKARNEKIFRDSPPNPDSIILLSQRLMEEWRPIRQVTPNDQHPPAQRPMATSIPNPPPVPPMHQKIFCDGSFDQNSSEAGYGVVMKNPHGAVIDGRAGKFTCSSAMVAEAKALLEACKLATTSPSHSIISSDCQGLTLALRGPESEWPWECFAWLLAMKAILLAHDRISLTFIPRRQNKTADKVAKWARQDILPYNWIYLVNVNHDL
ncbi:Putative ribonuclease H protein At1g65750 [Linum perenne]